MTSHRTLARQALLQALTTRKKVGLAPTAPLCPFDLAEKLKIEVRFVDIPSMEGMYVKRTPPLILVAADRPAGRQVFTCAHELGHHEFGHGTRADTLDLFSSPSRRSDPDEYLANTFAGFLLMPKTAVMRGFSSRGWTPAKATPEQIYVVAGWLGVSYEALVTHLCYSLQALSDLQKETLLRTSPQRIRQSLTGQRLDTPLHIVDLVWSDRPADLRVGDFVLAPHNTNSPPSLLEVVADLPSGRLLRAKAPGIGSLETADGSWHVYVRVMKTKFAGRSIFRHLEDPDYGCSVQDN
jgi:Zn-dependent peptidase ImmA (M78 family)